MSRRPGTSSSCAARRKPQTLEAYVQVAIDANAPAIPTTAKKGRRRRKKNQREASNQSPPFVETKPATIPAPSIPKRRKRRSKFKNYESHQIPPPSCKFRVRGLVTPEELEDEDEVEELQEELCVDFSHFGELENVTISRERNYSNLLEGDVIVTFRDAASAFSAFNVYDGKVFGGKAVTCFWETQRHVVVVVKGMMTPEELEDPDEMADVEEMMQLFRNYGEVKDLRLSEATGEVTVVFNDGQDAEKVVQALNGSQYGGREVTACLELSRGEAHIDAKAESSPDLETKRVATPTAKVLTSTNAPELQELIELLVKRLAALQERAHKQNKATSRSRRLVLGMHEVRRGLVCNKIVLLIIATDFHGNEAVEDKYTELMAMATERDVPVLAPMNRYEEQYRIFCIIF
ncbi:hypothetical protein V7S43_008850 [Phytophthora oleae]|uniref:RRM domain-containing protein n=1 Tax=Phytophthora oleae TaxID=2107226 RepID=A0ABD3FI98_9STRA